MILITCMKTLVSEHCSSSLRPTEGSRTCRVSSVVATATRRCSGDANNIGASDRCRHSESCQRRPPCPLQLLITDFASQHLAPNSGSCLSTILLAIKPLSLNNGKTTRSMSHRQSSWKTACWSYKLKHEASILETSRLAH